MIKKKSEKKTNVVSFPSKLTSIEKEIEAIIASEFRYRNNRK